MPHAAQFESQLQSQYSLVLQIQTKQTATDRRIRVAFNARKKQQRIAYDVRCLLHRLVLSSRRRQPHKRHPEHVHVHTPSVFIYCINRPSLMAPSIRRGNLTWSLKSQRPPSRSFFFIFYYYFYSLFTLYTLDSLTSLCFSLMYQSTVDIILLNSHIDLSE